jgi:hypothetical protein
VALSLPLQPMAAAEAMMMTSGRARAECLGFVMSGIAVQFFNGEWMQSSLCSDRQPADIPGSAGSA